jgi:threonine/homoserine/homoserine lactone efflux protein
MADFSVRSQTLRSNEGVKHFVGMTTAWGNALVIAAFARVALRASFDLDSLIWLTGAALLLWPSSQILKLLEAEDKDG